MLRRHTALVALALWLAPSWVMAQDAGVIPGVLPEGHPGALPEGHPNVHGGQEHHPEVEQPRLPESFAEETPGLPPGTIVVRVVSAEGTASEGVEIRVGTLRDGERGPSRTLRSGPEGMARVDGLETGSNIAYRVSTELEGARFSTQPFQLPNNAGYRAQLVRFDVDHVGRGVLLWDARIELHFKDDRLIVVERMSLVNLTGMSFGREPTRAVAYSPREPLRFELPAGHTAFTVAPSMSDLRITEEHGAAVLRGSLPPTGTTPVEIAFQYHIKLTGGDLDLHATLPLPVVTGTVISEAPRGLTMSVVGMPPAEARDSHGERVLLTGVERRPSDPPWREVNIHLGGIPAAAGPARTVAALLAFLLVAGALVRALARRTRASEKRERGLIDGERELVLTEARELREQHLRDEIGPVTYEKRRRELTLWLAALLKEQAG